MTHAVQGRSLPVNIGTYPAIIEGVEGYMLTINGVAAFLSNEQADSMGRYWLFDGESNTAPVEIVESPEPQARSGG